MRSIGPSDDHRNELYLEARGNACFGYCDLHGLRCDLGPNQRSRGQYPIYRHDHHRGHGPGRYSVGCRHDVDLHDRTGAAASAAGPAPVTLGTAAGFAILTKAGVTDVPDSVITGDVGASPISGTAILVTCAEVTGTVHSVDGAGPNNACELTDASFLTTAVSDMELAYADAAGRTVPAPVTELGAGNITGRDLSRSL